MSPRANIGGQSPLDRVWRDFASDVGQWTPLGFDAWSIEHLTSGDYVGQVGLNFPAEFPEREIGLLLWEEFEGKGYAFEAAKLARAHAFETLKFDTLVSYIDPSNARSIKLAEKMGAAPDLNAPTPNDEPCLVSRHKK